MSLYFLYRKHIQDPFFNRVICFLVSSFLKFFKKHILDINPLVDIQLVKIFFHSVACSFVRMMISFAIQKIFFRFMRSCLLLFLVCALTVSVQKVFSCAIEFKTMSHFLLCQIQRIWSYIEVLYPFRVEFCAGRLM